MTDRLVIRMLQENDKESLYRNHLAEDFKRWFPNEVYDDTDDAAEAIDFFCSCVRDEELPFVLAIELQEDGNLIGDIGINEVDGKDDEIEIGFSIKPEYGNRGFATEALKAMCDFASARFKIDTLHGRALKGNDASIRVLSKCGFTYKELEMGAEDDPYGYGMMVYKLEFRK